MIPMTALIERAVPVMAGVDAAGGAVDFLRRIGEFPAEEMRRGLDGVWERLVFRAGDTPFLWVATLIFLCAIVHTFLAVPITRWGRRVEEAHGGGGEVSFPAVVLHFLGEVEAVFGVWAVVLLAVMAGWYGVGSVTAYLEGHVVFTEALFVVVIMVLAATRPVGRLAERLIGVFAGAAGGSPRAWWLSILVLAPMLGSLITEPGAMTIAAVLLARKFYLLGPSPRLSYVTLGLLFVHISVGGVLTNFAAPPVLMVSSPERWNLGSGHMAVHYGSKAVLAVVVSGCLHAWLFRKEFARLAAVAAVRDADGDGRADWLQRDTPVPGWVTVVHAGFLGWTVMTAHHPVLFLGGFLFFLAFTVATNHHQNPVELRGPVMVGFFLAGLVVHGGLQAWWLGPVISRLGEHALFFGSALLTSFNDNAAITYLAAQAGGLTPAMKYAVLSGAVTGGGLTVIANAPNPAGQALLARFFGDGISPSRLLLAALVPTLVVAAFFLLIPDPGVRAADPGPPPPPVPLRAAP